VAKDYVGRKQASKKVAKSASKGKLPLVALMILVAAIAGFGSLLYSIKDRASKPAPLPAAVSPKPAEKTKLTPLPEKPKERSYIHELETKEVEVKVDTSKTKTNQTYQMQCASFRNQNDAQSMKATIAFSGLSSQVKRSDGKNGVWYRVVLGPYSSKRTAEGDRHKLQRSGIDSCQIWNWNWD
jgi:cell division protein FtsN